MNISETIKMLEDKYNEKKTEPVQIKPKKYISLSFHAGSKVVEKNFLKDLEALGFSKVIDSQESVIYQSITMEMDEAEKLRILLDKKRSFMCPYISSDVRSFNDLINYYQHTFTVCIYDDSDRKKNIESSLSSIDYRLKLYDFESTVISGDFRDNYCSEMTRFLKNNFKTSLTPKFMTEDVIKSFVNEIFDISLKIASNNFIDLHTQHYPYQYLIDFYPKSNEHQFIKEIENNKSYDLYKEVSKIIDFRFSNIETFEATSKNFIFDKSLDNNQIDDENFSTSSIILESYNPSETIISEIVKVATLYIKINNAHEIDKLINGENVSSDDIYNSLISYFNGYKNFKDWPSFIDPTKSQSNSSVHIKDRTQFKPI